MPSTAVEILREVRARQRIHNRRVRGCTCPPETPENAYVATCQPHADFADELDRIFVQPMACGCPARTPTAWMHGCGHVTCEEHRADHECLPEGVSQ